MKKILNTILKPFGLTIISAKKDIQRKTFISICKNELPEETIEQFCNRVALEVA